MKINKNKLEGTSTDNVHHVCIIIFEYSCRIWQSE